MKKSFITIIVGLLLMAAPALACDGPNCSASGNFDIDVSTAAGGVSADIQTIHNGLAGGIGAAGGITSGEAQGAFGSWGPFTLGSSEADLNVYSGGLTNTNAYRFQPISSMGHGIGIGSSTDTFATVGGSLEGEAHGLAYSHGNISGVAGQGSLDGSLIGDSALHGWDSEGTSFGVAAQGSIGHFYGTGCAFGHGSYELAADIDMWGLTYSESYRGIVYDNGSRTELMGTNTGAFTKINSSGYDNTNCIAHADVDGGFVAGGAIAARTVQTTNGGVAAASMNAAYIGTGKLGCTLNASATGYTNTSITTTNGYNGSIVSASSGAHVSNTSTVD